MSQIRRVLLVGHCGFDGPQIARAVRAACPEVEVKDVYSAGEVEAAGADTLLLINRQLGYGFGADSGVELIAKLAAKPDAPACILISNYEDAQQAAVAAGARPGFGKSSLHDDRTRQRLREAILGEEAAL